MAGQSRLVVNRTIQATRLVVGYFRRNAHKSREDILNEARALAPLTVIEDDKAGEREAGRRAKEGQDGERRKRDEKSAAAEDLGAYEPLRRFIFSRLLASTGPNVASRGSCRTQKFSVVLLKSGVSLADLRAVYERSNNDLPEFVRQLRHLTGPAYSLEGPREIIFSEFAGYVAEYFQATPTREEPQKEAAARRVSPQGVPLYYRCGRCMAIGQHWSTNCDARKRSGMSDVEQICDFISQYRMPHGALIESLGPLRRYLVQLFKTDLRSAPFYSDLLPDRLGFAVILGLATHNLGMQVLYSLSESLLLSKLRPLEKDFPKCLSPWGLTTLVQEFLRYERNGGKA
jgi:hypothetical protein